MWRSLIWTKYRIYFHNLNESNAYTVATWLCCNREQNGKWTTYHGGGASTLDASATKLRVFDNTSNLDSGKLTLFGIKNS